MQKFILPYFIPFIFISSPLFSQQSYDWSKYSFCPFLQDSCQPFVNWYTKHNIIRPITESNADIEIRLFTDMHPSNITLIKCYKDSIVYQEIQVYDNQVQCDSAFIGYKNVFSYGKGRVIFSKEIFTEAARVPSNLVDSLVAHHLFTMKDFRVIIKQIEQNGVVTYPEGKARWDYMSANIFEIKLFDRYRNFGISVPFMDSNASNIELNEGRNLFVFMGYILTNQKRNNL